MRITLKKLLLALLVAGISPSVSAMSLGEGQILSNAGEPLSVNIALLGNFSRDVRFYQVRNVECHSSVIGRTTNGCDSLYEGSLTFLIKQRPDGQYFLRVTGEKSGELFYRIIIKTASAADGTAFKAFEFLPEFKADAQPAASNDGGVAMDIAPTVDGRVLGEKMAGVMPNDENAVSTKSPAVQAAPYTAIAAIPAEIKTRIKQEQKLEAPLQPAKVKPLMLKSAATQLQIKKSGEYADDIYALEKENGEIEQQIALLEKQITFLKEVISLKSQIGASSVAETGTAASSVSAQAPSPVSLPVQSPPTATAANMLTRILLAVVLVLLALLWWVYSRQKNLKLDDSSVDLRPTILSPSLHDDRASLDLTGAFVRPKW